MKGKKKEKIKIEDIIREVAVYYEIDELNLISKTRTKYLANARFAGMYIAGLLTKESLKKIGLCFGSRNHSTVIYGKKKISKEIEKNWHLRNDINIIIAKLKDDLKYMI